MLYKMPTMWVEGVAIWAFWVFLFYAAMVVVRMVGLTTTRMRWTCTGSAAGRAGRRRGGRAAVRQFVS